MPRYFSMDSRNDYSIGLELFYKIIFLIVNFRFSKTILIKDMNNQSNY